MRQVRPLTKFSNAFCISSSETASKADVASSRMRIDGFWKKKLVTGQFFRII